LKTINQEQVQMQEMLRVVLSMNSARDFLKYHVGKDNEVYRLEGLGRQYVITTQPLGDLVQLVALQNPM
jgi:hypothetical protein